MFKGLRDLSQSVIVYCLRVAREMPLKYGKIRELR